MQPQAVIFDVDGTLVDTEHLWDTVRRGLVDDAGLAWPSGATQAMMGMSTLEWSTYLVTDVGLPMRPDEAADATIDAMAAHYRDGITILDGAVEAVRRMAERHLVGLASSSPRRLIDAAVAALGVGDVLTATVSTEEVAAGKPAPDGYLRAAELLAVSPHQCVAVEDSSNGIRSALAAGMKVVAVPPASHPPATELLARATVVSSLRQLDHTLLQSMP